MTCIGKLDLKSYSYRSSHVEIGCRWHGKDSEDELKELVLDTLTPLTTETTTGFLYKKVRYMKCTFG